MIAPPSPTARIASRAPSIATSTTLAGSSAVCPRKARGTERLHCQSWTGWREAALLLPESSLRSAEHHGWLKERARNASADRHQITLPREDLHQRSSGIFRQVHLHPIPDSSDGLLIGGGRRHFRQQRARMNQALLQPPFGSQRFGVAQRNRLLQRDRKSVV